MRKSTPRWPITVPSHKEGLSVPRNILLLLPSLLIVHFCVTRHEGTLLVKFFSFAGNSGLSSFSERALESSTSFPPSAAKARPPRLSCRPPTSLFKARSRVILTSCAPGLIFYTAPPPWIAVKVKIRFIYFLPPSPFFYQFCMIGEGNMARPKFSAVCTLRGIFSCLQGDKREMGFRRQ